MVELLLLRRRADSQEGVAMDSIEETEQPRRSTARNQWKPKLVSDWTVIVGGIGLIALSLFLMLRAFKALGITEIHEPFCHVASYEFECLIIGVLLFGLAITGEALSRFRIMPPSKRRVQNELTRCLIQLGLLDGNNTQKWKGMFSVAPIGRWDTKTKRFSLPFLLRHAKATDRQFETIEQSIASFAGCRDVAVEIDNTNRIWNMRLDLWYGDDPYEESLSHDAPW